jgi:hypothetical protein
MTNKDYFISLLGFAPSADAVEAALTDANIVAASTYTSGNSIVLKTAAVETLQLLLSTPDTSSGTGETANSITYDRQAILERIKLLQQQLGKGSRLRARNIW